MANCIRKPIRHTFATGETSITFETPQKTTANAYEQLRMSGDHLRSLRIVPFRKLIYKKLYVQCVFENRVQEELEPI